MLKLFLKKKKKKCYNQEKRKTVSFPKKYFLKNELVIFLEIMFHSMKRKFSIIQTTTSLNSRES